MITNDNVKIDFSDLEKTWNKIKKDYQEKYLHNNKIDFEYLKKWYDEFFQYYSIKEAQRPYLITVQTSSNNDYLKILKEQIENNQLTTVIPDDTRIEIKKIPLKCSMCGEEFEDIWDYAFCPKCRELYLVIRDQILSKFVNENVKND